MPAHRRSRLVTALSVLLALESVTMVAARAAELRDAQREASAGTAAAVATQRPSSTSDPGTDSLLVRPVSGAPPDADAAAPEPKVRTPQPAMSRVRVTARRSAITIAPAATTRPAPVVRHSGPNAPSAPRYRGRNHVWSPALGIDKRVYRFPCSRAEEPGNVVYRWGCAGRNNVYLMGHAANVFAGLNRAYYNGRLRAGLKVYYADSTGTVRTYAVRWWKVVYPTPDVDWAWASQGRPSMTLQTCIGKRSEKRLMVRLVQVAG